MASGVYFPVSMLPVWAQYIACALPHTYALDAARRCLYGTTSEMAPLVVVAHLGMPPLVADLVVLALGGIVLLPLGWHLFGYSLLLARQDGRLARWV